MTYALSDTPTPGDAPDGDAPGGVGLSAGAARLARLLELTRALESVGRLAAERYGAAYVLVDRTGADGAADLKALVEGDRLVDLWDLDPLLWDDAHRAAVRLVEVGEVRIIRPEPDPA